MLQGSHCFTPLSRTLLSLPLVWLSVTITEQGSYQQQPICSALHLSSGTNTFYWLCQSHRLVLPTMALELWDQTQLQCQLDSRENSPSTALFKLCVGVYLDGVPPGFKKKNIGGHYNRWNNFTYVWSISLKKTRGKTMIWNYHLKFIEDRLDGLPDFW